MEFAVISILNGVIYGLLLFMVSAGLTLIFGMMGVLNFAHASFYMLGAYIAYTMSSQVNFWAGLLVAPLVVGAVGILVERYLLRRVHAFGHAHELLLTFGLALIFEELIKLFYGDFPVNYQMPDELRFTAFTIFGTDYPFYRIFIGTVAVIMFLALYVLLSRTRIGIVVRAAERLPNMAEALGHNIPVVFMGVFGAGAALAGLAGAVAGAFFPTNPNMALELGVIVFVVVVVGGLGSLKGSLVASLMIGLFSSFAVGIDVSLANLFELFGLGVWAMSVGGLMTMTVSSISATIPFLLMLIVLLVRPAGLMGERN
jgi:branched-chain amino acid transport system permease protein